MKYSSICEVDGGSSTLRRSSVFSVILPAVRVAANTSDNAGTTKDQRRSVAPSLWVSGARDHANINAGLKDFILPLIAIRKRKNGHAVSIIKAGMKVIGRDSGPV